MLSTGSPSHTGASALLRTPAASKENLRGTGSDKEKGSITLRGRRTISLDLRVTSWRLRPGRALQLLRAPPSRQAWGSQPGLLKITSDALKTAMAWSQTQTDYKENARDGAGSILKFFKWFERTAWIKERNRAGREFRLGLNGAARLTDCSFVMISCEPLGN